jgi:hypothetical protein
LTKAQFNDARTRVLRGEGQTSSERYLKELCDNAFLSLWSYPGIYRDQGGGGSSSKKEGKEVCDLLVVFDRHVIIFSDKHCKFARAGDLEINWKRWFRKTIVESARQVWGAERWISVFPHRLFLDRACTRPFPISLPDRSTTIFHRVVVAHGISETCCQLLGGSGSLAISSELIGQEQHDVPFNVGWPEGRDKGYVHVFDDAALLFVLRTLDTVTDFVSYLTKKEALFHSGRKIAAAGEEELLACYLRELNSDGEHDFVIPSGYEGVLFEEGHWDRFAQHPQRQAQLSANKISYAWDKLIERFSRHVMSGTEYFPSRLEVRDQEKILRFMAREGRTRRRLLAGALLEKLRETPASSPGARVVEPSFPGDPYYVFVFLPRRGDTPNNEYREVRCNLLMAYCRTVKINYPEAEHVVGVATESGTVLGRSEDAVYLDASHWTEQDQNEAEAVKQEFGLLKTVKRSESTEEEYPSGAAIHDVAGHVSRNSQCPCGSRKRYKRCHGREIFATKIRSEVSRSSGN